MLLLRPQSHHLVLRASASTVSKPLQTQLARNASSSAMSARRSPSTSAANSSNASPPATNTVNPPLTTLPAPLELPTRAPETSAFSHYFALGKAYLVFFKSGIRHSVTNFTGTRPLQSRIDKQGRGTITALVEQNAITRSEMQHILRARHDIRRLPVFGLIFLICGEFSPLVLPFVASVVPYTCRIPAQLERERRIIGEKRDASWGTLANVGSVSECLQRGEKELNGSQAWHVARVLGVAPKMLPFEGLARWRIKRRVEYLKLDDTLVQRGGGWRALDAGEELVMAVQERGMPTVGKSESELRQSLDTWEALRKKTGDLKAGVWLVRPEQWKSA
ncbi:hypothetical protein EDC01DRAFT_626228 [Geopyxis carbonaria]|nr:hypothetical protein EDC01DRAFT_626228 [Geopyxis carbonaria]